jgi:2-dehydro-3-deoxygalactonokinase
MILIDWGTTRFRAYRVGADERVLDTRVSARGAGTIAQGGFRAVLDEQVGAWIEAGETRVLMCGMAGSRRGWQEVEYVGVPAGVGEIAAHAQRVDTPGIDARIVPGLRCADAMGVADVMRGEETEIVGCLDAHFARGMVCLPGTHTKWVRVEAGKIAEFATFMTGDVYAAVKKDTILAQTMRADHEEPMTMSAFDDGVRRSQQTGGLTHHLFGIRTSVLTGRMDEGAASSYLSGLLIGHEVKESGAGDGPVHLAGDAALCSLYQAAIAVYGGAASVAPEGVALRGLIRIGGMLQW